MGGIENRRVEHSERDQEVLGPFAVFKGGQNKLHGHGAI